jgi:DNA replication protein DnaC
MIDEETRRKLREMNMGEMVEALDLQEADRTCMGMPFDERVRMMVDHVHEAKRASSVKRLTQRARLRFPDAEPGEMIYDGRGIDGVLIREALTCQFMGRAANVVIEGCTGTGKSYLACCMAKQACRMRRSARYIRLPDLLMERDELAATERSDAKILKKYARYELLVIDEWLTEDVDDVAIRFLLELVERRYMDRSTVLCTQYSPADWHGRLGGGVQADAMIDRLVHGAVRIDLGDVNVRKLLAEKKG